ncbi:MAG: hypothetical protein HY001_00675 [Candidatus Portnoybacteria bacterium]|nr:hypothetical protein [Candidatus Portnoybacteria bacterium]
MNTAFFLMIGIVMVNVAVQFLLKKGVLAIDPQLFSLSRITELLVQVALNGYIMGALVLLGSGFILWLFLVSREQLSVSYPVVVGLTIASLFIVSRIFLKESLAFVQVVGVAVIIVGIFLVLNQGK